MEQVVVATIGYEEYALSVEDAATLLHLAARARAVAREGYEGPWDLARKQRPFLKSLVLGTLAPDAEFIEVEQVQDLAVQAAAAPAALSPEPF